MILSKILLQLFMNMSKTPKHWDGFLSHCSLQKDCLEIRTEAFNQQLPEMTAAFMQWQKNSASKGLDATSPLAVCDMEPPSGLRLEVVDIFCESDTY
jgi:hypothetical protein